MFVERTILANMHSNRIAASKTIYCEHILTGTRCFKCKASYEFVAAIIQVVLKAHTDMCWRMYVSRWKRAKNRNILCCSAMVLSALLHDEADQRTSVASQELRSQWKRRGPVQLARSLLRASICADPAVIACATALPAPIIRCQESVPINIVFQFAQGACLSFHCLSKI